MQRRLRLRRVVCAWCCAFVCSIVNLSGAEVEIYVSPAGNDQAAGTQTEPLATLFGAQQRLRELRAGEHADDNAQVWLLAGTYELDQPLEFTALDNSPSGASTTYAARPGQQVILRGGRTLTADHLQSIGEQHWLSKELPPVAREHVRAIDLASLQLASDHATHRSRARHRPMHPLPVELFSGSRRLPLASWPNSGWASLSGAQPEGFSWPVPAAVQTGRQSTGAMAHGFWMHDWQDSCEPVLIERSNTGANQFRFNSEHAQHVGHLRNGARYRIENLLSQLDQPGEWYLDRSANLAYLWPTDDMLSEGLFASTMETPISIYDVDHLTLRGITIEGAQACCIEIAGGQQVCIDNCLIRHAGNLGVNIYHGTGHRLVNCEITATGAGAVRVEGGQREALTACDHSIENCRLHDYAQLHLAYRPGINVYGVGVSLVGNEIFNAPHAAVVLHGNEHRVERNHIHHVCRETDDVGAIYLGHNPTFRGNKIRHNHIHDLGGYSSLGIIGIYLDDFASGTEVTHNVLVRAGRGVAIGGGRDNLVDNNLFVDCLAAVQIDCRGKTWARHHLEGDDSFFARCCREIDVEQGVFAERYPELGKLFSDSPEIAKGNRVTRNLIEGQIGIDLHDGLNEQVVTAFDNAQGARAMLANVDQGDYRARRGSLAEKINFENVGPGKVVYVSK